MAEVTAVPTALSDVEGLVAYSTNIPYCGLDTGKEDDNFPGIIGVGAHVGVTMGYNFVDYPPKTDGVTADYVGLTPDFANTILYQVTQGITMANYMITTTNTQYPIIYSDNYERWAFPSNLGNVRFPTDITKCVINPVSKTWYVIGSTGTSNVNCSQSKEGIVWENFTCDYMPYIVDLAFDQYGMGIAIGYGGTNDIAFLLNDSLWFPLKNIDWTGSISGEIAGIKRGPSWYVYGTYGIAESTNGYDWTGTFSGEAIISLDFDKFGNVFAISPTKVYSKGETWTDITDSMLDENGIPFSQNITDFGNMVSVTSTIIPNSIISYDSNPNGYDPNGNYFFFLFENSSIVKYRMSFVLEGSLYRSWAITGNDTKNITVLTSDSSEQGKVGIYIANVFSKDVDGNDIPPAILTLFQDPDGLNSSFPINVSTVGLTATSYASTYTRDLAGITYDTDLNDKGMFESISGTTSIGPTGTFFIEIFPVFGASGGVSVTGTTGFTSEPLSSFSFSFGTDIYSPKQFMFTGVSGNFYEFDIYEASKTVPYNFQTNTYGFGGDINTTDYFATDPIIGTTSSRYFNSSAYDLVQNMGVSNLYRNQLNRLKPVLETINTIATATGSTGGMISYMEPPWYSQVLSDSDIINFYTAVQNFMKDSIGSYNTNSIENFFNMVGVLPLPGVTTFKDLLSNLGNSKYLAEYTTILSFIAGSEYELTTDKTFTEGFASYLMTQRIPMLSSIYSKFSKNLSDRQLTAFRRINNGSQFLYNSFNNFPTYTADSTFRFDYNGVFLSLYLDGKLLHQYQTYGDVLTVNFNFNQFNSLFNQLQTVPVERRAFYIEILDWNSQQSNLDLAIAESVSQKIVTDPFFLDDVSTYEKCVLLSDSLPEFSGITGISSTNFTEMYPLFDFNISGSSNPVQNNNVFFNYTLSKLVGDRNLKARLGNMMTTTGSLPLLPGGAYLEYFSSGAGIFSALYSDTISDIISSFLISPWINYSYQQKQLADEQFFTTIASTPIEPHADKSDYKAIFDRFLEVYRRAYTNQVFLPNYDSTYFTNPRFPTVVSKTMLKDWILEDMKGTTGLLDTFPNKQFVVPISSMGISVTVSSMKNLCVALEGITGLDPTSQESIHSIYSSFYDEILQAAGITGVQNAILNQRNSSYGLAKDFTSKMQSSTYFSPTFFDTYFASGCSGAASHLELVDQNSEYLEVMNTVAQSGATALFGIASYQAAQSDYQSRSFNYNLGNLNNISPILTDTVLQTIVTFLKEKFTLEPANATKYLTAEQTYQYSTFFNAPSGSPTLANIINSMSTEYTPITDAFIDVNALYSRFVSMYSSLISGVIADFISSISSQDIDGITTLVGDVLMGNTILNTVQTISRNLRAQAQVYIDLYSEFQTWKYKYLRLKYLDDDFARYKNITSGILAETPLGITGSNKTYTISSGIPSNFIVNIPPFDSKYWKSFTDSGVGSTGYQFPRYNPNWKYYVNDSVAFDSYGTTGFTLYTCINTERLSEIKGIPPGSIGNPALLPVKGITGTSHAVLIPGTSATTSDLTSLLLWKEYHSPFEIDLSKAPKTVSKYDRYTYDELNYSLTFRNDTTVSELMDDRTTDLYDPRKLYYKGDRVIYNNSIFQFQGSEILYRNLGLAIPPGSSVTDDLNWKILSSAGDQPGVAPSCGGIWMLDPNFNDPAFTGKYAINDIVTRKNVFNPYVCPEQYDNTVNYSFGDKVVYRQRIYTYIANSMYKTKTGATGPVIGITPPSEDTFDSEAVWRCCPYLDMTDPGCVGLNVYDPLKTYKYGDVVIYNNLPFRYIFNNANVQDFNKQSAGYSIGEQVEFMGFIFVSRVNSNTYMPNLPTPQDRASPDWSIVQGYSGPTAAPYNSQHDYSSDFHILKINPVLVSYQGRTWQWVYNPGNVDYTTPEQQYFKSLTCISGVPPPRPYPLEPWKYLPDVSGATAYSNSTTYNAGDQVTLKDYCFECVGSGYSSAVVNEVGDQKIIELYSPTRLLLTGGIDVNESGGRFLEQCVKTGNFKDNYDIELGYESYGTPKWGNGITDDTWSVTGFCSDLRRNFATTLENTLNTFIHDYQICTGNFNPGNLSSLQLTLSVTSGISGNILTTNINSLLKPSFKTLNSITSLPNLNSSSLSSYPYLSSLMDEFRLTQFHYYSGLVQKLTILCDSVKTLNAQLNSIDREWYNMLNYSSNRSLPLYAQLFKSFYEEDRYQPTITGKPRNSKPLNLNPLACFLDVYIFPGDTTGNKSRFEKSISESSNGDLNNILFHNYDPVTHANISKYVKYYSPEGYGSVTKTGAFTLPLMSSVIDGDIQRKYNLCDFSPVYSSLKQKYTDTIVSINSLIFNVSTLFGHAGSLGKLYSGAISDLSKLYKGVNIGSSQFDLLYNTGEAHYCGTDIPILTSIISDKDLDLLELKVPLMSREMWFTDPDKNEYTRDSYREKSGNKNLSELAFIDTMPNVYQFQDYESIFKTLRTYRGTISLYKDQCIAQYSSDQRITNNTPVCMWNSTTKSWGTPVVTGGISVSAGYCLYQPIGGIRTNNTRESDIAKTDDQTLDAGQGWDSPSADRTYMGAEVTLVASHKGRSSPMRYETPDPFLVASTDLYASQGKQSPFIGNRLFSFLPYVFHVKKVARIEPDYCTLETPGRYPNTTDTYGFAYGAHVLRNIELTTRRQQSENIKSKTIQIVVMIAMTILAIVVIVASIVFTAGTTTGIVVLALCALYTAAGIGVMIAAATVKDPAMKELLTNVFTNPAAALANLTPSPANLSMRCRIMASNREALSDDIDDTQYDIGGDQRPSYSTPTYNQYMWARSMVSFIEKNRESYMSQYNPYLISSTEIARDSYYKTLGYSDTQIFQTYMVGLTGTSGLTSWSEYSTFIAGMTGYTSDDIASIMQIYGTNLSTVADYESTLSNPVYVTSAPVYRPATIEITGIYYLDSKGTGIDLIPPNGFMPGGKTSNLGAYAKFSVLDPGDGLFILGNGGSPEGIVSVKENFSVVTNPDLQGVTHTITFGLPIVIQTRYCTIYSQYGVSRFEASIPGSDLGNIPFTYDGLPENIGVLVGKRFSLTSQILGTESGSAAAAGAVSRWPTPQTTYAFRGAGGAPTRMAGLVAKQSAKVVEAVVVPIVNNNLKAIERITGIVLPEVIEAVDGVGDAIKVSAKVSGETVDTSVETFKFITKIKADKFREISKTVDVITDVVDVVNDVRPPPGPKPPKIDKVGRMLGLAAIVMELVMLGVAIDQVSKQTSNPQSC